MAWSNLLQFKNSDSKIALVLCIGDYDTRNTHSGIAYKHNGQIRLFHLTFHFRLVDEEIHDSPKHYLFVPFTEISDENIELIMILIERFKGNKIGQQANRLLLYNQIAYGIYFSGGAFNPLTLVFQPNPGTMGLSCSTFILAIFATYDISLIRMEEWQERNPEDTDCHNYLINALRERNVAPAYIAQNITNVGCVRYRPEEVVSSITHPIPAGFEECSQTGSMLKNLFFQ